MAQGKLHVGKCERAVLRRHELLALDERQQVEHRLIEHVPRADLALDHVRPRSFDVHFHRLSSPVSGLAIITYWL